MKPLSELGYKVAPSFAGFAQESEVYVKNKKPYIDMRNPKTGTLRTVRAYLPQEWERQYGTKEKVSNATPDSLKIARGFRWGPIMLIKTSDEDWLSRTPECRYATDVGWYIASDENLPFDHPQDLKRDLLTWDKFKEGYLCI